VLLSCGVHAEALGVAARERDGTLRANGARPVGTELREPFPTSPSRMRATRETPLTESPRCRRAICCLHAELPQNRPFRTRGAATASQGSPSVALKHSPTSKCTHSACAAKPNRGRLVVDPRDGHVAGLALHKEQTLASSGMRMGFRRKTLEHEVHHHAVIDGKSRISIPSGEKPAAVGQLCHTCRREHSGPCCQTQKMSPWKLHGSPSQFDGKLHQAGIITKRITMAASRESRRRRGHASASVRDP
jgi:hypothetical protein